MTAHSAAGAAATAVDAAAVTGAEIAAATGAGAAEIAAVALTAAATAAEIADPNFLNKTTTPSYRGVLLFCNAR